MKRIAIIDNFKWNNIWKEVIIDDISIYYITPWYNICWMWFDIIYVSKWIILPKEYEYALLCRLFKWWELIYDNKWDIQKEL